MKNHPPNQEPGAPDPADLEIDVRLTKALTRLPDVPVPSNFTARVIAAVDLEEARQSRRHFQWSWHSLFPRIAVTAAVVLFAGLTFRHYEVTNQRTEFAKNLALVAGSQPLPSVDALNDFEVIQRMSQPAHADDELLALMQ